MAIRGFTKPKDLINDINTQNSSLDFSSGRSFEASSLSNEGNSGEDPGNKKESSTKISDFDLIKTSPKFQSEDDLNDLMKVIKLEKEHEERITPGKYKRSFQIYDIDDNNQEPIEDLEESVSGDSIKEEKLDLSINDYQFIINIGKGGYGKVDLVKKKTTGDLFALKIIDIVNNVLIFL